jgi:glycosyltransferase involved in cell wall biosynthesis
VPAPLVSVIVTTFNRAAVCRIAVESALRSTLHDLEVLVVGDHCTDSTAEELEAIGDDRVRFVNLPRNHGEQSGPSNQAIGMARGEVLAFLNHDDLWFPDHLDRGLTRIRDGADLAWTPIFEIAPATPEQIAAGQMTVRLGSVPPNGRFDATVPCIASSWVLRKEAAARAGPWRAASSLHVFPSQDWLFRIHRSGARMEFVPEPDVIALHGGVRKGSYTNAESPEHRAIANRLASNSSLRSDLSTRAAISGAAERIQAMRQRAPAYLAWSLLRPARALAAALGHHPMTVDRLLRNRGRGNAVRQVRRFTGLPSDPAG